ncbi:MAG: M43 family zinc metalloprotease [Ferruginibacter sp.]
MKKFYLFFATLFCIIAHQASAQKTPANIETTLNSRHVVTRNPNFEKCGFAATMEKARTRGFNSALYEQVMQQLIEQRRQQNTFAPPTTIYTLPVVFHVIYNGTTEPTPGIGANLSYAQIQAQIDQLNADYADLSGSVYGVAEDMGVRFVAAKVDPSGNYLCEAGVQRINFQTQAGWTDPSTLASIGAVMTEFDNTVKPQTIWDPYRYINIWLADFSSSGLLGYASFPAFSTLAGLDDLETDLDAGVVVESGTVGSVSLPGTSAPYDYGRTLTHELGHFFGLRHINGDGACLTDYCADTPPQADLTSGCPATGTLNGCTPSVPMMFENYMDYSNDACLNTFTLNQSERCQVVMLNSPRRSQLRTSNTGVSPFPNRIYFKSGTSSVTETATGTCPRFKDVTITLGIDAAATGNATVSLTKAGTATDVADYAILTPSVSYTNADGANKNFTIRVYDDALVESSETITLGINITGTGVQTLAACPAANTFTITITDDDYNTDVNNTTPVVTLLNENFGTVTGSNQVPAGWTVTNSGTATNKFVGNNAGASTYGFTGNTLHISNGNATAVGNGTAAMAYTVTTTTDARVTTPTLNASGMRNLSLTFDYVSNGEEDATGIYDFGVVYYSTDGGTTYTILRDATNNIITFIGISTLTNFNITLPPSVNGTANLKFLFRWLNDNSVGNNPPFAIDNVVVTGNFIGVEAQANQPSTENVSAGTGTHSFYSGTDGQIIAKVSNTSANIGCLTANVSAAGTALTTLTTNVGSYQRSSKVITLVPTVANTTATYTATLYYTTAEMAAWGASVPTLKLLKVRDGVNLASTLTSANAVVVTPTAVDDQRATKGYVSYTANFTGGFSQFLLVSPTTALPITSLNFDAKANAKNISLVWTTETENNNKGFVIERSTNGSNFERIGWKDGKINSSQRSYYTYDDNFVQPGVTYFYRLRQTDLDARESLSPIRQAKIKGSGGMTVIISPNPTSDAVKVFVAGVNTNANISLLNAKGQLVKKWSNQNVASNNRNELDLHGLAKGVYMLSIETGGQVLVQKLIIQ